MTTENGIKPLQYRIEPIAAESYRTEPNQGSGTPCRYIFLHFFLLLLAPRHFSLCHCTCTPNKERPSESILYTNIQKQGLERKVWNMFLGKVWNGGLERRSGSHVGSGPCSGPYKLTHSQMVEPLESQTYMCQKGACPKWWLSFGFPFRSVFFKGPLNCFGCPGVPHKKGQTHLGWGLGMCFNMKNREESKTMGKSGNL